MTANAVGTHVQRYGLIGLIIVFAVGLFAFRIFGRPGKSNPVAKAADAIESATKQLRADLQEHNKAMDENRFLLDGIQAISDERERLKQLADFANQRRASK